MTARETIPAVLTPALTLATLDPSVQSFIDRWHEGAGDPEAETAPGPHCFRPADAPGVHAEGPDRALPVLIYLQVATGAGPSRDDAMQALADATHVAVVLQTLDPGLGSDGVGAAIAAALAALAGKAGGIDARRVALAGDDLGGLAALVFASGPGPRRIALLILATPVLGPAIDAQQAPWPAQAVIVARAAIRADWITRGDIPAELPAERLARLPPTVLITAEIDPWRGDAERLAHRMMAAECELSAVRMLGAVHDFTWLPALIEARPTRDALAFIARSVRAHLFPLDRNGD